MSRRKGKIVSFLLIFTLIAGMMPLTTIIASAATDAWDGNAPTSWYTDHPGETSYTINNAEELAGVAKLVNDGTTSFSGITLTLASDINLSGYEWTPIGYDTDDDTRPFSGKFDGGNHNILNMTIGSRANPSTLGCTGLFGVAIGSEIMNTAISSSTVYVTGTGICAGGLAGYNDGNIENCSFSGTVEDCYFPDAVSSIDFDNIGGLVGYNGEGDITNCYTEGNVKGGEASRIGGFVGLICDNGPGTIQGCYSNSSVTGSVASLTGGFAGSNSTFGVIVDCYATGDVTGGSAYDSFAAYTGGFVGYNIVGKTYNSYATGDVTGGDYSVDTHNISHKALIGGFAGKNANGEIKNCYSTGNVTGGIEATLGGFTGGNAGTKMKNVYWNKNAVQTVNSIIRNESSLLGNGEATSPTDTTYGLVEDVMKTSASNAGITYISDTSGNTATTTASKDAFIQALNGGLAVITGVTVSNWKEDSKEAAHQINGGYPIFVTADSNAPVINGLTCSGIGATKATIGFQSNEAGSCYYLVNSASDSEPSESELLAGIRKPVLNGDNSFTISGLTASTDYSLYMVVSDRLANITTTASISFKTAEKDVTDSNSGGGSHGHSGGSGIKTETRGQIDIKTDRQTLMTTATTVIKAVVGTDGRATASVTKEQMSDAVKAASEEAQKQGTVTNVKIRIEITADVKGVSVMIPQDSIKTLNNNSTSMLTVNSPFATVSFDKKAIAAINSKAGSDISIEVRQADIKSFTEAQQKEIGNRPVYDLTIRSGSTIISDFDGGTATVSIPYTPKSGEEQVG